MQFFLQQWRISLQKLDPDKHSLSQRTLKNTTHTSPGDPVEFYHSDAKFGKISAGQILIFCALRIKCSTNGKHWYLRLRLKQTLSHIKRWKARFILVNWFVQTVLVNEQISTRCSISKWHFMSFFITMFNSVINCFIYLFISHINISSQVWCCQPYLDFHSFKHVYWYNLKNTQNRASPYKKDPPTLRFLAMPLSFIHIVPSNVLTNCKLCQFWIVFSLQLTSWICHRTSVSGDPSWTMCRWYLIFTGQ